MLAFICGFFISVLGLRLPIASMPSLYYPVLGLLCVIIWKGSIPGENQNYFDLLKFFGGVLWSLLFRASFRFDACDPTFWFLCGSQNSNIDPAMLLIQGTWIQFFTDNVRVFFNILCRAEHSLRGVLTLGMIGGVLKDQDLGYIPLYKSLGLMHILVISGSHFIFLSKVPNFFLEFVPRTAYSLRLLGYRNFLHSISLAKLVTLFVLFLYATFVNWSPPCQRAFLALCIHFYDQWTRSSLKKGDRFMRVMLAQILLFPSSFFSISNALTWSFFCANLGFEVRLKSPMVFHWIYRESRYFIVVFAYFGSWMPFSILLNPLMGPLGNVVLFALVVGLLLPKGRCLQFIDDMFSSFHEFLNGCVDLQEKFFGGGMVLVSESLTHLVQIMLWVWLMHSFYDILKNAEKRSNN